MATYLLQLATVIAVFRFTVALPEQGVWDIELTNNNVYAVVTKSMYNNTPIAVKISCKSDKEDTEVNIGWSLRYSPCAEEYIGVENQRGRLDAYYQTPTVDHTQGLYTHVEFIKNKNPITRTCTKDSATIFILPDETELLPSRLKAEMPIVMNPNNETTTTMKPVLASTTIKTSVKRSRREVIQPTNASKPAAVHLDERHFQPVVQTWRDGIYLFILKIEPVADIQYRAEVNIAMKGPYGFLSAIEWPLLPFYGTMCIVYVIYGFAWLVMLACNWRDLLRIQFWIGGVIILGMLEKAVFFAEYETINNTGKSMKGAVVFAELVSCLKRTLARMLVIIVSLGFGIVKPRLGPMLHRVIGVGALFFILGSVEGCLRVLRRKGDMSNDILFAGIPLAVTDAAICYWVFTSLVQTTRTLRLRRNIVKLSLYRHFTNTLIFAVLASVAFMIWSLKMHKLAQCITDWKEIWVDDAYWHLLFSVVLMVIMILWRPTINNQRYAFSPLLDQAEDEVDEEPLMNDAFVGEGMKMRGGKGQSNGSPKQKDNKNKVEDDLKWIEENIPASVADTALPSLLDSDEEIMTTKFEMSKME